MNFEFSDEQVMLRDQARRLLNERQALKLARQVSAGSGDYDAPLWREMLSLGWTGVAVPEEFGGLGLGYLELCVLAEEFGRSLAPVPFSSSIYLASEALLLAGSDAVKHEWLPRLVSGEVIATVAIAELRETLTPNGIGTTFDGETITGAKIAVPDGMAADVAVVLAKELEGDFSWFIVDLKVAGVERAAAEVIDPSRPHACVTFANAPATRIGTKGAGWSLTQQLLDRAAVVFAFEQVGGAAEALRMATEWAKTRYAFGRPIGSFQAIKHKLADIFVSVELARSHAYYGAWALSANAKEIPVAAAGARIAASEAFWNASKENIQTHGGIGFTYEADPHLYYRRSKLLAVNLGSVRTWREKLMVGLQSEKRVA